MLSGEIGRKDPRPERILVTFRDSKEKQSYRAEDLKRIDLLKVIIREAEREETPVVGITLPSGPHFESGLPEGERIKKDDLDFLVSLELPPEGADTKVDHVALRARRMEEKAGTFESLLNRGIIHAWYLFEFRQVVNLLMAEQGPLRLGHAAHYPELMKAILPHIDTTDEYFVPDLEKMATVKYAREAAERGGDIVYLLGPGARWYQEVVVEKIAVGRAALVIAQANNGVRPTYIGHWAIRYAITEVNLVTGTCTLWSALETKPRRATYPDGRPVPPWEIESMWRNQDLLTPRVFDNVPIRDNFSFKDGKLTFTLAHPYHSEGWLPLPDWQLEGFQAHDLGDIPITRTNSQPSLGEGWFYNRAEALVPDGKKLVILNRGPGEEFEELGPVGDELNLTFTSDYTTDKAEAEALDKASMSQGAPGQVFNWALSFVSPDARFGLVEGLPGHHQYLPPFP